MTLEELILNELRAVDSIDYLFLREKFTGLNADWLESTPRSRKEFTPLVVEFTVAMKNLESEGLIEMVWKNGLWAVRLSLSQRGKDFADHPERQGC